MLLRPHRSPRSHLTLLAAGALLASPLLTGCGFNYATNRVNTISAGINDSSGEVDVLGAVVIAGQDDIGLFVATLVNDDTVDAVDLDGLVATPQITGSETIEPMEIPARGRLGLIQSGGIEVTGDFSAGDFVDVTLSFSNDQITTVSIPVVTPCHQYDPAKLTTLTIPTAAPTTEAPATEESSESSESPESSESSEPGVYSCEPLAPLDFHGEGEGEE